MQPPSPEPRESARQRALRIRLDYVHHPDKLARGKRRLTLLAVLAAAAYCGWAIFGKPAGRTQFSPGPVAAAHQHFEHDCQACHTSFVPLRGDASPWPAQVIGALAAGEESQPHRHPAHALIAQRCQTCHFAATHHRRERAADVTACGDCHREHQGAAVSLRQVANERCAACHRNIAEHRDGPSASQPGLRDVDGFARPAAPGQLGHPEFRSLQHDPGTIKFDHRLHLTAGLPANDVRGGAGKPLKSLADLPTDDIARYRRADQPEGARPDHEYLVQLDCASCHREVQAAAPQSGQPLITAAEYQPINFDQHCRACHPLPFDPERPDARLPHGLPPAAITTFLNRFYAAAALLDSAPGGADGAAGEDREPWRPQRPIAGRAGDRQAQAEVERTVPQRVTLAQQFLQRQAVCTKCHDPRPSDAAQPPGDDPSPQVVPAAIPTSWFRYARFHHRSHQMLVCAECHVAAQPSSGEIGDRPAGAGEASAQKSAPPPGDRDVVMIATRDTCLRCHAKTSGASAAAGPVSADCVLCHRYHGADATLHVATPPGSPVDPSSGPRRTISDWLAPTVRPSP